MEYYLSNLSLSGQFFLAILAVSFLFQLVYYFVVFGKVAWFSRKNQSPATGNEKVSIIICAKNEAENLQAHLPVILEQNYPAYEVVVVNDCSEDETQEILENFQKKYPHLRVSRIKNDEKFSHGKKLALTIGIKAAVNEWLLLTDADCKPEGKQWLATMARNFTSNNDIVLGYGAYRAEKGLLNLLIRFDTFFIALQYLGLALNKSPYMGVGRNLAYRKSLFMKNKGFATHSNILSGDDDLFINEVATRKNTRVEFEKTAITYSVPKKTFRKWINQKLRHYTTGYRYKFKHKFMLGAELFLRLIFYIFAVLLLFDKQLWIVAVAAIAIRFITQLTVFGKAMKKLNEKKLLLISPIFDIVLPLINIFLYTVNTFNSKQHRWK